MTTIVLNNYDNNNKNKFKKHICIKLFIKRCGTNNLKGC